MADQTQTYKVELDISQFTASASKLKDQLKQVEQQIVNVDKKKVFGGDGAKNADIFSKSIGKLGGAMDLLPGPVQNIIGVFEKFGKVLLANPIGLIITAIVGALALLAKAFAGTDSGALKFAEIMKQIGAVVDVVMARLAKLATGLVDFLSGDFSKGLSEMGDAFTGIGKQIGEATAAAKEYADVLDEINEKQDLFVGTEAKLNKEIANYMSIAADQTKSGKQRLAALEEVAKREKEIADEKVTVTKALLDNELNYTAKTLGINKNMLMQLTQNSNEYVKDLIKKSPEAAKAWEALSENPAFKKLIGQYADVQNAEGSYDEATRRVTSRISGLKKEEASKYEEAKKKEVEALKKVVEAEQKRLEDLKKIQSETIKVYEDIALSEADTQIEATKKVIDNEKVSADAKLTVVNEAFNKKKAALEANAKTELDLLKKQLDDSKNFVGPLTPEEAENQKALQENLSAKILQQKQSLNQKIVSNEQQRTDAVKSINDNEKKKFEDNQKVRVDTYQKTFDEIKKIGEGKGDVWVGVFDDIQKGIDDTIALKKKINQEFKDGLIDKTTWEKSIQDADAALTELGNKMKKATANWKEIFAAVGGQVSNLIGMISQNSADAAQAALDNLDKQFQGEVTKLDELYKKKSISEAEYNKRKEALDKEQAAKVAKIKTEQAKKQRTADILQAIVNTALGVVAATSAPFPLDIIMPILIGALGVAQIALIASKPIPTFAKGGRVPKYAAGGMITGPTHSAGGVPINAEGGEYIINKNVAQKPGMGYLLDNINKGNSPQQPATVTIDHQALASSIVAGMQQVPVNVVETDITRVQKKVGVIESKSSW